ncbi:DnaJ domain containing protein [Novymonas esmeraldas]|uniref:DnaJ domain containing protein n=1 Tax=Novymonas esmeraldas TaxID=1808958 RepID=A0AAW0EV99_9TRYP
MHVAQRWRCSRWNCAGVSLVGAAVTVARRHCATVPTDDDVRKAYRTLGVDVSATLADVKRRYGDLAKEHHPDVSGSSAASSTNRMTDINSAYNTLKQFHQLGRRLAEATHTSGKSGSSGPSSYYTRQDTAYQPWYEDIDPIMYELMWEEMRRQNDDDAAAAHRRPEAAQRPHEHWRSQRGGASARQRPSGGRGEDGQPRAAKRKPPPATTTTWPEEQVRAMVNMYQDGKSFDFIANALGKESAAAVVEEFNRWSNDNQPTRRRGAGPQHARRHRPPRRPGAFYYAESPDEIPFELYQMMEEEPYYDGASEEEAGNPFAYYAAADDDASDMSHAHATPFYGGHQMSGGPPPFGDFDDGGGGRRRVYNSSRRASYKPTRHHRGGPPHKNRRYTPNSHNNSNSGGGGGGAGYSSGGGRER